MTDSVGYDIECSGVPARPVDGSGFIETGARSGVTIRLFLPIILRTETREHDRAGITGDGLRRAPVDVSGVDDPQKGGLEWRRDDMF